MRITGKRIFWVCTIMLLFGTTAFYFAPRINLNPNRTVGEPMDSLNGVVVYYNGGVGNVESRNTQDGYNLGLKYQCVEFVKRYYYERFQHKMPDAYGHAKDFFDKSLADEAFNPKRGLWQYNNPGKTKPHKEDLLIFGPTLWNRYGHVAIISAVTENELEIIQQNPGPFGNSRETFALSHSDGHWEIQNTDVLGWLRKSNELNP